MPNHSENRKSGGPSAHQHGGYMAKEEGLTKYIGNLLKRWPVFKDIDEWRQGKPLDQVGLGDTSVTEFTRGIQPRIRNADLAVPSICPYCSVGCGQIIYVKDGKIIDIEGNPASPINAGTLCPKGAATYSFLVNPLRVTKVKYRAPHSDRWEERSLDWAMERIAQLVKQTRDAEYEYEGEESGKKLNRCPNIASLGGATLDNEENYLIKKLFGGGLGMVWIENQARV
jgi:formate dehydrogenase major subunit